MLELHYFPNIIQYTAGLHSDVFDTVGDMPYQKRSFQNRCILAGSNGPLILSIPIEGGRNVRQSYHDVLICTRTRWRDQHWKSIASAYGKSPLFYQYANSLYELYQSPFTHLLKWNLACLQWVDQSLGISTLDRQNESPSHPQPIKPSCTPRDYSDPMHGPFPRYPQVFSNKLGFLPNLSILDFVLCMGRSGMPFFRSVRADLA